MGFIKGKLRKEGSRAEYMERLAVIKAWGKKRKDMAGKIPFCTRANVKCPECGHVMEGIGTSVHNFMGYRCPTHTNIYATSLFFNAICDVYKDREVK